MINDYEKKLIKRYYLSFVFKRLLLITITLTFILWLILEIIGNIIFFTSFQIIGFIIFISIILIYTICFIFCSLKIYNYKKKVQWKEVLNKINIFNKRYSSYFFTKIEVKKIINSLDTNIYKNLIYHLNIISSTKYYKNISKIIRKKNKGIIDAIYFFDIKIIKLKKYVFTIIITPLAILLTFYIHRFSFIKQQINKEIKVASFVLYKLQNNFRKICSKVIINNPLKEYRKHGYYLNGYLYPSKNAIQSHISVKINNEGKITEVNYKISIDIRKTKEENIVKINKDLSTFGNQLRLSEVKAISNILLRKHILPKKFISEFKFQPYDKEIIINDGDMSFYYCAKNPEDCSKYNTAYVYLNIKPS